jgi:hypothetical protein
MAAADFNGDSMLDLAVILYDAQRVEILMRKVEGPPRLEEP